ncbi:MAG: hypothetical protein WC969_00120 [Elusimicrobiota bacterium]|jgi:hypothetical protein
MRRLKDFLADHCDGCTMCRFARDNPSHWFGKAMEWHGTWCPAWRAWKDKYGNKGVADAGSRAS